MGSHLNLEFGTFSTNIFSHNHPNASDASRLSANWCLQTPERLTSNDYTTMRGLRLIFLALLLVANPITAQPMVGNGQDVSNGPSVVLDVPLRNGAEAPEGHFLVSWEALGADPASPDVRFELQFATDPSFEDFERRDPGPDRASFLSGLPAGTTYVRVRSLTPDGNAGAWSGTGSIAVAYPSMGLVRLFVVLGTAMFLVLVALIWRGHLTNTTTQTSAANG